MITRAIAPPASKSKRKMEKRYVETLTIAMDMTVAPVPAWITLAVTHAIAQVDMDKRSSMVTKPVRL
jgi:hypothetical protein